MIKEWRNQQIDVLRQKKILTDQDQLNYYTQFIEPSFHESNPKIILFSFFLDKNLIGYGGLTNCSWEDKRSELSIIVSTERYKNLELYEKDLTAFIKLMKQVNFDELRFNRIFTETYDIRPYHIRIIEQNDFRLEGRLKEHVFINGKYVDSLLHGCLVSSSPQSTQSR
jgi:RimJ/RimL family protein N-acetyltransferase